MTIFGGHLQSAAEIDVELLNDLHVAACDCEIHQRTLELIQLADVGVLGQKEVEATDQTTKGRDRDQRRRIREEIRKIADDPEDCWFGSRPIEKQKVEFSMMALNTIKCTFRAKP
jgi:hypothetical protein